MRWALGKSAGIDPKARQTRRIRLAGRGARMGLRETPARLSAKSQVRYLAVKCFALPLAAHATPVRPYLAGFFYYAARDGAPFPAGPRVGFEKGDAHEQATLRFEGPAR